MVSDNDQKYFQLAAEIFLKASGGITEETTDKRNILAEALTLSIDWPSWRLNWLTKGANETTEPSRGVELQIGTKYGWNFKLPEAIKCFQNASKSSIQLDMKISDV